MNIHTTNRFLNPRIDEEDTKALIAFLKTLSGNNIFTDEKWSDPFSETGELTITNDCPTAIGEESMSICQGDIYKGYHATGLYQIREKKANGCDSMTLLNLEVMESPELFINKSICIDDSFLGIDKNHALVETGTDYVTNEFGVRGYTTSIQTSIILEGHSACDTIAYIDLEFLKPIYSYSNHVVEICEGQSHLGYTRTNWYTETLTSVRSGCDSINQFYLQVNPAEVINETHTICQGEEIYGHNTVGTYKDTLVSNEGCYTFRYVDLNVMPTSESSRQEIICEDENVEGYTTSGTYSDIFRAANGCDSTRTLDLIVHPKTFSDHEVSICEGENFMGYVSTGFYQDLFTNANGCDSLRSIELTVMKHTSSKITVAICEGESYEGYSEAGNYIDLLQNFEGCDSTRQIDLTILEHSESYDEVAICKGDSFWGYDKAGDYSDLMTNVAGCDSTRNLSLSLLDHSESYTEVHLCPGEEFEGYKTGDQTEYYTNAVGCDSTRYISIINIPMEDAVCTQSFDTDAKLMSDSDYMSAYPNPVHTTLNLSITKPERLASNLRIYDHNNRLVKEQSLDGEMTRLDFSDYESGLYLIYVEDGKNVFIEKVLKI